MFIDFSTEMIDIRDVVSTARTAGVSGVIIQNHRCNTRLDFHRKNCAEFSRFIYNELCFSSKIIILEENEKHIIRLAVTLDNDAKMHIVLERKLNKDGKYGSTWNYNFLETNTLVCSQADAIKYMKKWLDYNRSGGGIKQ